MSLVTVNYRDGCQSIFYHAVNPVLGLTSVRRRWGEFMTLVWVVKIIYRSAALVVNWLLGVSVNLGCKWQSDLKDYFLIQMLEIDANFFGYKERKWKFGANSIKRVAAGADLPTPWLFELAELPEKWADYCLDLQNRLAPRCLSHPRFTVRISPYNKFWIWSIRI